MTNSVTGSKVKPCIISKKQNILRLKGLEFNYHLRATRETRLGLSYTSKPVCGKKFEVRLITYTELHNADGIARLCSDCRESVL